MYLHTHMVKVSFSLLDAPSGRLVLAHGRSQDSSQNLLIWRFNFHRLRKERLQKDRVCGSCWESIKRLNKQKNRNKAVSLGMHICYCALQALP